MFGIIQIIRKSYRSVRKPQMMKQMFEERDEAEHFIMRYRQRFPYTTADFCIAEIKPIAEYKVEVVQKEINDLMSDDNDWLVD